MRELSTTELSMQDQVKADQREGFKIANTYPLPEWERAEAGFEIASAWAAKDAQPAGWIKVHKIRYNGSFDGRNSWGL